MAGLRLFLAAEIDSAVLDRLEEAQAALKPAYPRLRWLRRKGMHLTLKFLGNVAEERLPELTGVITSSISGASAATVKLTTVTAFPSWRRVNVVVAECAAPPALAELHAQLQRAFAAFNVPAEARKFRPHITLARPLGRQPEAMAAAELSFTGVSWRVGELGLFQSVLDRGGARYEVLQRWPLG